MLKIKNLKISFKQNSKIIRAVANISFNIPTNKIICLVGESGSGKSVTALSLLKLLPATAEVSGDLLLQ